MNSLQILENWSENSHACKIKDYSVPFGPPTRTFPADLLHLGTWLSGAVAVLGLWLDLIIVKIFSNLNDAMINLDLSEEAFSNVDFPVLKEKFVPFLL